ncbi:MAG: hypothetical protein KatS3mg108_0516 [Isosphaeraceae bacterium]|jgi:hypothetical protein|nr:MAG: hypothetical protein KatS3mg108_0516 [Isosphaeraceae bacterium]
MCSNHRRPTWLCGASVAALVASVVVLWLTLANAALAGPQPNHNRCEADSVSSPCPGDGLGECVNINYYCFRWLSHRPQWCVPMTSFNCLWLWEVNCGVKMRCDTHTPFQPEHNCTETVDRCIGG